MIDSRAYIPRAHIGAHDGRPGGGILAGAYRVSPLFSRIRKSKIPYYVGDLQESYPERYRSTILAASADEAMFLLSQ